jgi:hypothetical protein
VTILILKEQEALFPRETSMTGKEDYMTALAQCIAQGGHGARFGGHDLDWFRQICQGRTKLSCFWLCAR